MHMTYSTHRQTVHMANSHIALIPFVNPVRPFPPTVSSPSPPPVHKYHLSPLLSFTSTLNFTNILSSLVSLIATPKERCAKSVTVYYSTSQPVPSSQHHPHSWEKITDPCEILRQGVIHLRTICGWDNLVEVHVVYTKGIIVTWTMCRRLLILRKRQAEIQNKNI